MLKLLGRIKPDVVFSKGSFVAVPVGIAANIRHVPIITHDSDTTPGLANRLIGRRAKVHATGMPVEFYDYPRERTVFSGIPISGDIKKVDAAIQDNFKKDLGIPISSQVVTVVGGGNGALTINNLLLSIAPKLLDNYKNLHILHISGQAHESSVAKSYDSALNPETLPRVKVIGFTDEVHKYTGAADLVISRAGATFIAELAIQAKASIIIPSPFLAGGHQLKNAEQLKKQDAAVVLANDISADKFYEVVNKLLQDKKRRQELAANITSFAKPGATKTLAEIILSAAASGTGN